MPLTELAIRNAKPRDRLFKLSDGGGLQLWVTPDGAKRWRLAYRYACKQKLLALGVYPLVGAKHARLARDDAKRLLAAGKDPSLERKAARAADVAAAANSFGVVADELLAKKRLEGKAASTTGKIGWLLDLARPELGHRPVAQVTTPEVLRVLKGVEGRGALETARRLRSTIGEVFRLAIATGRAENDPTSALRGAIASPVVRHRAAIIEPGPFGGLLRAIDGYSGAPETRAALQLLALTFVRPGEVRAAEWTEVNLEAGLWSISAQRMKMRRPHRVPLAPQAVALLRDLQAISGRGRFLFPSARRGERCLSDATLIAALRRLGYAADQMTPHGFRSAASSMLNESGLWHADAIERQLAHVDQDSVRRAYARADFWDERVRMMEWWANRLDEMRTAPSSEVVTDRQ